MRLCVLCNHVHHFRAACVQNCSEDKGPEDLKAVVPHQPARAATGGVKDQHAAGGAASARAPAKRELEKHKGRPVKVSLSHEAFGDIYVYIYICVCVCVYTYRYIYTHTHTHPYVYIHI